MNALATMPNQSINIIGNGSMGHLWAAYLIKSGQSVSLFARDAAVSQSIVLESPNSPFEFDIEYFALGQFSLNDTIIVTTKAPALESICRLLARQDQHPTTLLLMMNGLGLDNITRKWLPKTQVLQASTTHGAYFQSASQSGQKAVIQHTGYGETMIGSFQQNQPPDPPVVELLKRLNQALPKAGWSENHSQNLWTKLLVNSIINPITAVYNVNNGALLSDHRLNVLVKQLCEELAPLLKRYLGGLTWQQLCHKTLDIAEATSQNSSSMRQDILKGRKTEIDFITGYILKKAGQFSWRLPKHQQLFEQIKQLEIQTQTSVTK